MNDPNLLVDIYDVVVDPEKWPAILDRVARAVDARGCILFGIETDGDAGTDLIAPFMSTNYDPDLVRAYIEAFREYELEDQRIFARHSVLGDNVDIIGDDVLASSPEELAKRPNARAMAEFGIAHRAGALLSKDQPARDRFSVQFSQRQGRLRPENKKVLQQILPHLAKACELARPIRQLDLQRSLLADALDLLTVGVCLIRADGAVIAHNREFERQLQECRLFRIAPNGRLEPTNARDRGWFSEMTLGVASHGRFGAKPRKEAMAAAAVDGPQLAVEVIPLNSELAIGSPNVDGFMVCSLDTTLGIEMDTELIAQILGLSKSETQLVELLADGLTNRQIAEKRDRSIETVNTQVKGLLSKTDCANRTQLIRRAASIGAHFLKTG